MYGFSEIYLAIVVADLLLIASIGTIAVVGIYRFVAWAMKTVAESQKRRRTPIPRAIVANQRWRT